MVDKGVAISICLVVKAKRGWGAVVKEILSGEPWQQHPFGLPEGDVLYTELCGVWGGRVV